MLLQIEEAMDKLAAASESPATMFLKVLLASSIFTIAWLLRATQHLAARLCCGGPRRLPSAVGTSSSPRCLDRVLSCVRPCGF